MFKKYSFLSAFILSLAVSVQVWAQTPANLKPSVVVGDVTSVGDNRITVAAKTGPVEIQITEKSKISKVSAENPNPATATPGALSDIGVGDKLTVTGILSPDGKSLPARAVYFMTKADIAKKNEKEAQEWRVRGITGKVTAVNPQTNQVTVETRTMTGSSNVVLTPKESAKFLRYAPDSIRFDEAKDSSLAEVKTGDMIRALGDKSGDGLSFSAEKVITGAFQTVAGTVKSIDVDKREVVIKNLQNNKEVTVVITDNSMLKKYPAEMAERFASAMGGGMRPRERAAGREGRQVLLLQVHRLVRASKERHESVWRVDPAVRAELAAEQAISTRCSTDSPRSPRLP